MSFPKTSIKDGVLSDDIPFINLIMCHNLLSITASFGHILKLAVVKKKKKNVLPHGLNEYVVCW